MDKKLIENSNFKKYSISHHDTLKNQVIPSTKVLIEVEIFYQLNKVNSIFEDNEFTHKCLSNLDEDQEKTQYFGKKNNRK